MRVLAGAGWAVSRLGRCAWGLRAELLTGAAIVSGWGLVTWGIADLTSTWQAWPLSAGVFLLGIAGWRLVARIMLDGLYVLSLPHESLSSEASPLESSFRGRRESPSQVSPLLESPFGASSHVARDPDEQHGEEAL